MVKLLIIKIIQHTPQNKVSDTITHETLNNINGFLNLKVIVVGAPMHKPFFPISFQTSSFTEQKQMRVIIFRNTLLQYPAILPGKGPQTKTKISVTIPYTKLGKYNKKSRNTVIPIHYTRVNWYSLIKIDKSTCMLVCSIAQLFPIQ